MSKDKIVFVCNECGGESLQWQGKCSYCGEWNTLKEIRIKDQTSKRGINKDEKNYKSSEIVNLGKIDCRDFQRISTGIGEFDRVLGNGIVPGSVILLGGDPGIGKSTLVLQLASNLSQEHINIKTQEQKKGISRLASLARNDTSVLYVSGEESPQQIKLRADRLGIKSDNLQLLAETDVDEIIMQISKCKSPLRGGRQNDNPEFKNNENKLQVTSYKLQDSNKLKANSYKLVIIDSIQTMYDSNYPSTPGSIVQVRECALKLQQLAKQEHITIILVGHVTKDGNVAGPRTLEHLVDVVLYLEGERYHNTRILRGVKNRFGATDEIGVFEMGEKGLAELSNPSKLFLAERSSGVPGSVVTCTMEGTRPFLVEIQALTSSTSFGYPKRTASGFDLNRLSLLIAVLTKRTGLALNSQDVYVNVVGGFRLKDPAVDAAVCLAIASAFKNKPLDSQLCIFGEIGLSGEIRSVIHNKKREEEARRLGFKTVSGIKYIGQLIKEVL